MSRTQSELLKKLSKYSKEDILKALGRQYNIDYIICGMINDLESMEMNAAFEKHDKAFNDSIAARLLYLDWKKEMCVKYGNGKTVKLSDIPKEEITRGAELERALIKATKTEQRLERKVDKLLKLEDQSNEST